MAVFTAPGLPPALIVFFTLAITKGMCDIQFTSEPEDTVVYIGETARFNCTYEGTIEIPFWSIGDFVYPIDRLPDRHEYRNQILIIMDVQASDSGRTYRCSFFEVESKIATLTVIVPEGNETITSGTPSTATTATTYEATAVTPQNTSSTTAKLGSMTNIVSRRLPTTAAATTSGSLPATSYNERTIVIASASAIVGVVIICATFLLILTLVLRKLHVKHIPHNMSEQEQDCAELGSYSAHKPPEDRSRETLSNYTMPDVDRGQGNVNEVTVREENQLDPVYYAICHGSESTNDYKIDQNSSYIESESKKEHLYEEIISEAMKLNHNCAYGCLSSSKEPQSPEAE